MIKVLINGINGKMGNQVANLVLTNTKMQLLGGLDRKSSDNLPYPVFSDIDAITKKPDVIIDFSIPTATLVLLPYCLQNHIAMVIATTGFSNEQLDTIKKASNTIPIFQSYNMSFEVGLLSKLIADISKQLPDAEIEIVETHHDQKVDAPSGTALMLADSINQANGNSYYYNFNRKEKHEKRNPKEIGFSSIRGGNIVGEHSVLFFSPNETLEIKHTAYSRSVFAEGAIKAAEFIVQQNSGFYTTNEFCLKNINNF